MNKKIIPVTGASSMARPSHMVGLRLLLGIFLRDGDMEIWKPIEGYEGWYDISNLGNVRSWYKTIKVSRVKSEKPFVLTFGHDTYGYRVVCLCLNRKRKTEKIHRLVLNAFIRKRINGEVCRHLDGDLVNNNILNLVWGTVWENAQDRKRHAKERIQSEKEGKG